MNHPADSGQDDAIANLAHAGRNRHGPAAQRSFVYIASPSFSGSTLLTFLLNAHPSVCTVSELKAGMVDVDSYLCSCGARVRECPFWREIQSEYKQRGLNFDLDDFGTRFERQSPAWVGRLLGARVRSRPIELLRDIAVAALPAARRGRQRTLTNIQCFADILTQMSGADVFVDASKDAFRLRHMRSLDGFGVKVIRLIRDGRGVMNSTMKSEHRSPEDAARLWRFDNAELDRVERMFDPAHWITVHYEQLCANVEETMARLFDFIGLSIDEWNRDFRSVEHHILGNSMRLRDSSSVQLDKKWMTELTPAQLSTFESVAGDLNRRYGYNDISVPSISAQRREVTA